MADLIPVGIDSETGQLKQLEFGVDTMRSGTNDFFASVYSGGDISIGASDDTDYVDVDATNATITFNVTSPGKFIVSFNFSVNLTGDAGRDLDSATSIRLTDGTTHGSPASIGAFIPGVAAFPSGLTTPCVVNSVFNFSTTGSKTVKLQKWNKTSSNVTSRNVLANSDTTLRMFAVRTAD